MTGPRIAYCGLTHLGLNSAVAAAVKGMPVVGFDPSPEHVEALNRGHLPIREPGLDEAFALHHERLTFTADLAALKDCDVAVISADVPTDDRGQSDLADIVDLLARVTPRLDDDATLVVLSQVPPGFTRRIHPRPQHLYYQVETLVFGRALERALEPERFIVGCANPGRPLPPAYHAFLAAFGCPILPMRYESAELAKIAINCLLVAQISAANTLAELCEHIGADWAEIAPSLRLDRRIGQHAYLSPGLGIAGGNLERDLATVCRLADSEGAHSGVVRAWIDNSRHRKDWVLRALHAQVLATVPAARIGILGLTYKENTHSTKNSAALQLIDALAGISLRCFDPAIGLPDGTRAQTAASALDAADGAHALAVMTPWPDFRNLEPAALAARMAGRVVVDPYGMLDHRAAEAAGLQHIRLGVGAA